MTRVNQAEARGSSPTTSPYRESFIPLAMDRWSSYSPAYLRALYGARVAETYARLIDKEMALDEAGKLQEWLALQIDGFSEATRDRMLWFTDEQQAAISEYVDHLEPFFTTKGSASYPRRAGKWLETKLSDLGDHRPMDIILGFDDEGNNLSEDPTLIASLEEAVGRLQASSSE